MPRIFNLIGRGFFFFFFFCLVLNKTGQAVLGLWLRLWPTGWVLLHVLTKTLKLWCVLLSHIHTHNLCVCLCVCVCVCERDRESQCLSLQKCPSCFSILNLISKNKKPSRQPPIKVCVCVCVWVSEWGVIIGNKYFFIHTYYRGSFLAQLMRVIWFAWEITVPEELMWQSHSKI